MQQDGLTLSAEKLLVLTLPQNGSRLPVGPAHPDPIAVALTSKHNHPVLCLLLTET
jgi:hypothetical protein